MYCIYIKNCCTANKFFFTLQKRPDNDMDIQMGKSDPKETNWH